MGALTFPPTLYAPPPVPPPSPGPNPPPVPEPIPVPVPVPIPPPDPGPLEAGPKTLCGSPNMVLLAICGNCSSGGPNNVAWTGNCGFGTISLVTGGAICTLANLGTGAFDGGIGVRSPPPPPPPAFLALGGRLAR